LSSLSVSECKGKYDGGDMNLHFLVIHELQKAQGSNANLILSDKITPINKEGIELIDALRNSYNKSSITYAEFSPNIFPFKIEYDAFVNNRSIDIFHSFSVNTMKQLYQIIKNIVLATGGYYVFCTYEENGILFDAIFLVRNTEGKIFNRSNNTFIISNVKYLNISDLAMACRINYTKYHDNECRYLSFIKVKQSEISQYFFNWISVDEQSQANSKEYTKNLYNILKLIEPPVNEKGIQLNFIEFISNVYNYIKSHPDKNISINDLSNHFFNDEMKIRKIAEENNILIDTEFNYDNSELRRFVMVHINADGIDIRTTRKAMDELIDIKEDHLIIKSPGMVKKIKEELEKIQYND